MYDLLFCMPAILCYNNKVSHSTYSSVPSLPVSVKEKAPAKIASAFCTTNALPLHIAQTKHINL